MVRGITYKVISKVHKNEYVRIFAKIDNWYVIQTDKDIVGVVYANYIKPINNDAKETSSDVDMESVETVSKKVDETDYNVENSSTNQKNASNEVCENVVVSDKENTTELTSDEQYIFDAINHEREKNGLDAFKIDDDLQNVCRIKAKDMVENDYFSHNSPSLGSPFEMMKKENIIYKIAGENIAGNSDNQKAVDSWMNSKNHRANILNNNYNYTGIAVIDSPKYGKIYVQMFIGK